MTEKNKENQETVIIKRTAGFTADHSKTEQVTQLAEALGSIHLVPSESTPAERILTKLLNTVASFILWLVPIYLACTVSAWWLALWLFVLLWKFEKAGRD